MKGFCFMTETKAANNEEYRKQIERKNKYMWGIIVIGIITAAVAYYFEASGKMQVDDYMIGVYCGIGVGLFAAGIALLIRNRRLLKDDAKLKAARLQATDERNIEIASRSLKIAAMVLLVAMYAVFLIGGLLVPVLSKVMSILICLFLVAYCIAWKVLDQRM